MKKLVLLTLLCISMMTGCGEEISSRDWDYVTRRQFEEDFSLIYMKDTKIIYYYSLYRLSPYYNENGKLCRYVDDEIVEVEE